MKRPAPPSTGVFRVIRQAGDRLLFACTTQGSGSVHGAGVKRILSAVLAASLLLPVLFAGSVTAGKRWSEPLPPITLDNQGTCVSGSVNVYTGMIVTTSKISQSRSGASGDIDLDANDFDICIGTDGGPMAWVGVSPKDWLDETQIIQVGIIECRGGWPNTACHGENNPHFFWSYGGCFPFTPHAQDLGPADYNLHHYAVWLDAGNPQKWHLQVDGAAEGTALHVTFDNSQLACWTGLNRRAEFEFERWDTEDSIGTAPSRLSYVTSARFGVYNQGWFDPLWPNGTCTLAEAQSTCWKYSSDNFRVYNTN